MRREGDESRYEEKGFQEYESDRQEEERQAQTNIVGLRTGEDGDRIDDRNLQEQENSDGTRDAEQNTAETQDTDGDTLPPGRVMLMERLCDLVQRLSSVRVGGGMEADVIDVLNAKVDEMEDLLVLAEETAEAEATADVEAHAEVEYQAEDQVDDHAEAEANAGVEAPDIGPGQEEDAGTEGGAQEEQQSRSGDDKWASGMSPAMLPVPLLQVGDQDIRDLASPLPWLTSTFKYSELSISPTQSHPELAAATNEALEAAKQAAQAQHDMAERVAFEADKLNRELAEVVKRLQARKEESDVSPLSPPPPSTPRPAVLTNAAPPLPPDRPRRSRRGAHPRPRARNLRPRGRHPGQRVGAAAPAAQAARRRDGVPRVRGGARRRRPGAGAQHRQLEGRLGAGPRPHAGAQEGPPRAQAEAAPRRVRHQLARGARG